LACQNPFARAVNFEANKCSDQEHLGDVGQFRVLGGDFFEAFENWSSVWILGDCLKQSVFHKKAPMYWKTRE
jgi:hypothetical protein